MISSGMPGAVVFLENAMQPWKDRNVVPLFERQTVRQYLDGEGIEEFSSPTLCLFNGAALLRKDWSSTVIDGGDVCCFTALPAGGGGGGRKNPLQAVLAIAMMVAAPYIAGAVAPNLAFNAMVEGALGITGANTLQFMALKGAISFGASALVSTVIPAGRPSTPTVAFNGGAAPPAPSPTYSLQGQGNVPRLGQPIPAHFGRHRRYPDLIVSEPFWEYSNNEQFVFQPHCLGVGEFDIEKIMIADTAIANFEEITYEVVEPGDQVTLFDPNVITRSEVAGQELKGSNEQTGDGYVGPFVANPVDTTANDLGVDILFPRGLYYANDQGGLNSKTANWVVEARPIDDVGHRKPDR